jgi:hypothetical protein
LLFLGLGVPAAAFAVLTTASVVNELFLRRPPATERVALSPAEMSSCNHVVRALLDGLVREPTRSWDALDAEWEEAWKQAETRCGFSTLADKGLGAAYDRMASVHRSLPRTKLKVREWMARFSTDLAPEIAEMRRALDKGQVDQGQGHE